MTGWLGIRFRRELQWPQNALHNIMCLEPVSEYLSYLMSVVPQQPDVCLAQKYWRFNKASVLAKSWVFFAEGLKQRAKFAVFLRPVDCFEYCVRLLNWRPGWKRKPRKGYRVGSLNKWVTGLIKSVRDRTRINKPNTNNKRRAKCASGISGQRDKIPEGTTSVPAGSLLA